MRKAWLIVMVVLFVLVGQASAQFEGIIKDTRSFLTILETQNVVLLNSINYLLAIMSPHSEIFIESMAQKILLEEEKVLISKSQKLLEEMEKNKKDIEAKITKVYNNITKINAIHLKVINHLSEKFDFLLKELDKWEGTPI